MLAALRPRLKADLAMAVGYRSEAVLRTPILALAAQDDHLVPSSAVAAWAARTSGGFQLQSISGGHVALVELPVLQSLLQRIDCVAGNGWRLASPDRS